MVIGINPGADDDALVRQFVAQTGVTFPVGWDQSRSYSQLHPGGAISPFPLDVVIDQEGRIAYLSARYDGSEILRVTESLLAR